MGAVTWAIRQRPVSHPRSSNRTRRSPASGSPTGFTAWHTTVHRVQAFEAQQAALSIDDITGEAFSPAPCHFVPSDEEVAHALIDVSVNTTECRSTRPVAEVVRPAKQRPVQRVSYFGPWIIVARHQQIADLRLELLHALLGRARAQIPFAVRFCNGEGPNE